METQDKKYSITLDRDITESNNLNELEMLAIEYCITDGKYEFDTKAGDVIKISSLLKYDYTHENEYTLVYDNHIEIQVNLALLNEEELRFIIKQLSN